MNALYCDCFSGISGDMFLSAMLDAGLPRQYLEEQLAKLGLNEFKGVTLRQVLKGALRASQLEFDLVETEHQHDHHHEHDHHHSRHLGEILEIIQTSQLEKTVKTTASSIFRTLGAAEARVHGINIEEVHFHEVGAVDSILDIVGAAIALHYFHIDQVYSSALPVGSGSVETQHGLLPLPAPATLELLKQVNAKVTPSSATSEMITPTGAAILATLAKFEQPAMQITGIGIGAGRRQMPWPNVLRLIFGEVSTGDEPYIEIETNIDDMNPQFYSSVMQHLFANGALDVYLTAIQMKKNRPAVKLSVIAHKSDEIPLSQLLLRETSTLGVRITALNRQEAKREIRTIQTKYGEVSVKVKILEGKVIQAHPEYEECVKIAENLHLALADIYREIELAAISLLETT